MWIPIVVSFQDLVDDEHLDTSLVKLPQPTFPFESLEVCEMFTNKVRENIMMNPIYIDGWVGCVEVPE